VSDEQETARREAEVVALEAAVTAAAVAGIAGILTQVTGMLSGAFKIAVTDPGRWVKTRRSAARMLRRVRPRGAAVVARHLTRAAQLGARQVGVSLPKGHDPLADVQVRQDLEGLDQAVTARLGKAAEAVTRDRIHTSRQLEKTLARVDAVTSVMEGGAGDIVARAVAGGTVAAAGRAGVGVTLRCERNACLACQSMCGSVPDEDGLFRPVHEYTARLLPWLRDGVEAVPLHPRCRCRIVPATEGLVDALRREAEREVARGESAYDSLPARLAAVDRVLKMGTRLPKSVKARAARDLARGEFSRRDRAST
jgi:hypothetical protein